MTLDEYVIDVLGDGSEVVQFRFDTGVMLEADAHGISLGERTIPWDVLIEAFDEDARTLKA